MVHKSTVHKGGSVGNSVGGVDDRGGVDDGSGVDKRGSVGDSVNRGSVGNDLRVGSGAVVGDLGDVTVDRVGVVVHVLDPAVGKGNRVRALSVAGTVAALGGVEVGVGVVVSDGVVVSVGGDLVRVDFHCVGHRVSHSMAHYSMPDSNSMANTHSMANAHSVANTNTMANSSKELGSSRGSSQEGRDGKESLWMKQVKEIVQCNLLVPAS